MLNKLASSRLPILVSNNHLESGMHTSSTVIQRLLGCTCTCPHELTLDLAVQGLAAEMHELLDEVRWLVVNRVTLASLIKFRELFDYFSAYTGVIDDVFILHLTKLDMTIRELADAGYENSELQDCAMMLAWICYFLEGRDVELMYLDQKTWDVTSHYRKAMHRFKMTGCIRSLKHETTCRSQSSLKDN